MNKYIFWVIICSISFMSCSSDVCFEDDGYSFVEVNYREWDLGLATFQYGTIQGFELYNDGDCSEPIVTIFLDRYFLVDDVCRYSGSILLDSIPLIFNQKLEISGNSFYSLRDADVTGEKYPIQEIPGFEPYIILTKEEDNCQKIFGEFQASFVFDDRFKLIDPMSPDTLYFTNGVFEAEIIN